MATSCLETHKSNVPNQFLWKSFDYPVDTLLPEMKIGWILKTGHNKFLASWRSPNDPSSGDLSFKLDIQGLPEFYLYMKEFLVYRSGPWNGVGFSGMPTMQNWSYVVNNFIENREEVAYSFKVTDHSIHTRFTLTSKGLLQMFTWIPTLSEWSLFSILPTEDCDVYRVCGSYSYYDMKTSPKCNCIRGFAPKNATTWALGDTFHGCVRKSRLSWRRDGFILMKKMKLPETSKATVDKRIGLKECEQRCSKDCNCTGFANMDIRNDGLGCFIWTGELGDMRSYAAGGQDLYVRICLYN